MNAQTVRHRLEGFDQYIAEQMSEWHIPGLAIGVLLKNEIILAKGYGYADLRNQIPVTPETIFPIGSASKAFTTLALGILADEGCFDWDHPIRDYLPWFKLSDPLATERITARDLACHRSGLPRHEFFWFNSSATRRELAERLSHLALFRDFRATYWYQNLTYIVAGELIHDRTGQSWEEFVTERIFHPLTMTSTFPSHAGLILAQNRALPYTDRDERLIEINYQNLDVIGPAGGINSQLLDMLKWVALHLNQGHHAGGQLISRAGLTQLHSPQVVIPDPQKYPETPIANYALGWRVIPYRGHKAIRHGGNVTGFASHVTFMPEEQLGVVILSNKEPNPVLQNILYNLYDRLLGLRPIDWNQRLQNDLTEMKRKQEERKQATASTQKTGTLPSHPLADYCGIYEHPGYGKISIGLTQDTLTITYNSLTFQMAHYHYDIFEYLFPLWGVTLKVHFFTDIKGEVGSLAIPFDSSVPDIIFKRVH